jgi:biotin carboxyl carrier protein
MNALTPKEVSVIQMALQTMIEENETVSKDYTLPFTAEARKMMKEIHATAKSALEKIVKASGHFVQLDAYNEGDEKEFLTKQS